MSQWNPTDYHLNSSQQQQWAADVLAKLALQGHEHILDLGCGDGKVTAHMARMVPHGRAVGLDTSADMIAFAQRTFPSTSYANLQFQPGDARSLTFSSKFDVVVSFACLHWVIDHRPVLCGIYGSLRPGGKALLQFGGKGNAAEVVKTVMQITQRPRWANYFVGAEFPWGFYSPEEYRPGLAEAGLQAVRVDLIPKDMVHQGPTGFAGWLRTTWMPYVQRVPPALQQAFLDEVLTEYLHDHPADANGGVHLNMVRLEVEAIKP